MVTIKKCVVSIDSLAGNSKSWKGYEDNLRQDGYSVTHIDIFDEKRPFPSFWDFFPATGSPDEVAASLDWAAQLEKVDRAVGEFQSQGCQSIMGLGIGVGANYLLLFRDGRITNQLKEEGGWFPKLKHSDALRAIAGANPHAEFPESITQKKIHATNIQLVSSPTYLVFGEEGVQTVPVTESKAWIAEAAMGNRNLKVDIVKGVEYMFMLGDLPPMPFEHSPFYDEEAAAQSWANMKSWLNEQVWATYNPFSYYMDQVLSVLQKV
ncbi:MAG: hypothetical protein COV45_06070 [Deltaproteobacteria bacterium CG11_big_fil_rev_8_21_14_0_20_47_16]|nr:MAG: hypothetical protein COV45_06070 [Deltaproteobacteria bacterium CG11_big_fil_rev_8_21_14_0_20_47_16]